MKKINVHYIQKGKQNTACGKWMKHIYSFSHDKKAITCNSCKYQMLPTSNSI